MSSVVMQAGPYGVPVTVFAGRESEPATSERGLAAARDGDGGVVLVQGDPGVGKSAPAAEAVRLARSAAAPS